MSPIRSRKDLGQNLLIDGSVRDRIVEAAAISPSDIVIEIGPGKGALTSSLAKRALFLLAVEIDKRLCDYLCERLSDAKNVEVRHGDFLRMNLLEEIGKLRQRFPKAGAVKIVSNVPFYITTPIITKIIESRAVIDMCVVTIQKEVAERFTASPGSKRYGAITLFLNYHAEVSVLFPVPREAFRPKPEVDGAVIRIIPRLKPAVEVRDEEFFFRVIRAAFGKRRKMLKNSLLSLALPQEAIEKALKKCGLDARLRAERLTIEDFAGLSRALAPGA